MFDILLQGIGFFGRGSAGTFLANLDQLGFFDYVLPFLIIFALIFGILNTIQPFKDNKGIYAVIAIAVGLMALQFNLVTQFFQEVFPRLGVALAVILVVLILVGLFGPEKSTSGMLLGVGIISAIVVLATSAGSEGSFLTFWLRQNVGAIVVILLVIGAIAAAIGWKPREQQPQESPLTRIIRNATGQ